MSNKPKISDRVEKLESQLELLSQGMLGISHTLENQRLAILSLSQKIEAMVYLAERNEKLDEERIQKRIVEANIEGMKTELEKAKADGHLVDAKVIGTESFVVIRELDKDSGKVVQDRTQIAIKNLPQEISSDFIGKKVGDKIEKDTVIIEITELYDLVNPDEVES